MANKTMRIHWINTLNSITHSACCVLHALYFTFGTKRIKYVPSFLDTHTSELSKAHTSLLLRRASSHTFRTKFKNINPSIRCFFTAYIPFTLWWCMVKCVVYPSFFWEQIRNLFCWIHKTTNVKGVLLLAAYEYAFK